MTSLENDDPWAQPPDWVPLPDLPGWLERRFQLPGSRDEFIPKILSAIRHFQLVYRIDGLTHLIGSRMPPGFAHSRDPSRIIVNDWDAVGPDWRAGTVAGGYVISVWWGRAEYWAAPLARDIRRRRERHPPEAHGWGRPCSTTQAQTTPVMAPDHEQRVQIAAARDEQFRRLASILSGGSPDGRVAADAIPTASFTAMQVKNLIAYRNPDEPLRPYPADIAMLSQMDVPTEKRATIDAIVAHEAATGEAAAHEDRIKRATATLCNAIATGRPTATGIPGDRRTCHFAGAHVDIPKKHFMSPDYTITDDGWATLSADAPSNRRDYWKGPDWGDVLFQRSDVLRLWPQWGTAESSSASDTAAVAPPNPPAATELPDAARRARPEPTDKAVREWMQQRVAKWPDDLPAPSEVEDFQAATARFAPGLSRDEFRLVRESVAPAEWRKQGPRRPWGQVKNSAANSAKPRPQN